MVFHWSLSDSKSPQVSRTLLSILANLNIIVWIGSTCPLISKSTILMTNPSVAVPRVPIKSGIIISFMFHIFLFPSKVQVLIFLFPFLQFYFVFCWDSKVQNSASSLFVVDYYKIWSSGRYLVICWYLKIPK